MLAAGRSRTGGRSGFREFDHVLAQNAPRELFPRPSRPGTEMIDRPVRIPGRGIGYRTIWGRRQR